MQGSPISGEILEGNTCQEKREDNISSTYKNKNSKRKNKSITSKWKYPEPEI